MCAAWHTGPDAPFDDLTSALVCYPAGASAGRLVEGVDRPWQVALSPEGDRLAWAELTRGQGNAALGTAALGDGAVQQVQRVLAQEDASADAFTGTDVQDLAWVDGGSLAVSTQVQSDDGPAVLLVDVSAPGGGWLADGVPVEQPDAAYHAYDSITSVDRSAALAVQRGNLLDDVQPPARAVRIDLRSGTVIDVLATAAEGRYVSGVSGGAEAVVYVTADATSESGAGKAYLRLVGETRGTPITGLPNDATAVVTAG